MTGEREREEGGGKIINGVKYIQLHDDNGLKSLSLEDYLYFTMRDIFINIQGSDYCCECIYFGKELTDNTSYDARSDDFAYTNVLNERCFVNILYQWLCEIHSSDFYFGEEERMCDNMHDNMHEYMAFDDWLVQFDHLKLLVKERLIALGQN